MAPHPEVAAHAARGRRQPANQGIVQREVGLWVNLKRRTLVRSRSATGARSTTSHRRCWPKLAA